MVDFLDNKAEEAAKMNFERYEKELHQEEKKFKRAVVITLSIFSIFALCIAVFIWFTYRHKIR